MIYRTYLETGLVQRNRIGLRILPHQLLETSWVLGAWREARLAGTLTVIEDGELGLPIAQLYPAEVGQLRRRGLRVAELGCLALDQRAGRDSRTVLRSLLEAATHLSVMRRIDCLAICVHPRHASVYRRRLGFHELGGIRRCPWACHRPAVGLTLMLGSADLAEAPLNWELEPPAVGWADNDLQSSPLDCREYFQRLLDEASPMTWPVRRAAVA
jgi:hypothetical protein